MSQAFLGFIERVAANIIDPLIALIALAAFIVFIWGVVDYIQGAADSEKRKVGQLHMIWGLIGLAIMFGARSIYLIMISTLGSIGL